MDEVAELRHLRGRVRQTAHDMCNSLGVALNYLDFLAEDIAGTDTTHPIWQQVEPIQDAMRRAVTSVRALREEVLLAEEEVVAHRAQHGEPDRNQNHQ